MLQQRLDYANTILIAGLAGRVEMEGQLEMVGHLQLGQYNRLELVGQLQGGQWKRRVDCMQTARPRAVLLARIWPSARICEAASERAVEEGARLHADCSPWAVLLARICPSARICEGSRGG